MVAMAYEETEIEDRPQAQIREPMDEDTFRSAVRAKIDDACDFIDSWIAPQREQATKYYNGEPLGNEEEGRNTIVMTEVRDKVLAIMPDLMRIFTSADRIAEFGASHAGMVEQAEQQTDMVNHVFYEDNPGFLTLYSALMDGLVRKLGFVTWRWSDDATVSEIEYDGLDQGQIQLLLGDRDVEILSAEPDAEAPGLFEVRIKRYGGKHRCLVEAVPPEELIVARDARDLDTASYVGRRRERTFSDLVAAGYDPDVLEEHASGGDVFSSNMEALARNQALAGPQDGISADHSMQTTLYVESFIRIDKDGDGVAELRRVCTIGNAAYVLHDEVVDEVNIAGFCPIPEPHTLFGASITDQVADLQRITTRVVRDTLDSLSETIRPRTWFVEGMVNEDDVANNELGGMIRVRQRDMVGEFNRTFLGQQAMPVIKWLDELAAKRTGVTSASQGLDPDVLQSTTKAAVTATISGAQARTEMIARVFAETGLKRLMKGIRNTLIKHQDRARMVRLRGKWVQVDPRVWDASLDVTVNVALGKGSDQDKIANLLQVAATQKDIIVALGPLNPLCDISNYRATQAQIVNLMGFADASRYFKEVPTEVLQQLAGQAGQAKPDPNMMLAQAEAEKVRAEIAQGQMKLELQRQDMLLKDQRERDKIRQDTLLKLADMQAKYKAQFDIARLEAMTDEALSRNAAAAQVNGGPVVQ